MGLDYQGKPDFKRERDLFLEQVSRNASDFIDPSVSDQKQPEEDQLFDDMARTYLKGEALKNALAELDPAGFIPVEDESRVRAAVARRAPDIPDGSIITFGLFKEACEYLAGSMANADEEFLITFNPVDPEVGSRKWSQTTKNQATYEDDWISAFTDGLLALGGVAIASYIADFAELNKPTVGVDSHGDTGEVQSKASGGLMAGIALLIELGVTAAAYYALFGQFGGDDDKNRSTFEELAANPELRKAALEDAGYDYENFKRNQEWNDYKAIKDYSLTYIQRNSENAKYDHWIGWMNVLGNQTIVGGALAMAPTFSNKWRKFYRRGEMPTTQTLSGGEGSNEGFDAENQVYESGDPYGPGIEDQLRDTIKTSMTQAVKGYFSTLITATNTHYDKSLASFSFYVDERILCCLIWFIGKVDTSTLKTISAILKLALVTVSVSLKDLINIFLTILGDVWAAIISLINDYIHKLINLIVQKILSLIAKIPDSDLFVALQYCLGLDWLIRIIDWIVAEILLLVQKLVDWMRTVMIKFTGGATRFVAISAERKALATMVAFIDALAEQLDRANDICPTREGDGDYVDVPDYQSTNELAADAAIKFVVEVQSDLFPVLEMPEDVRRKHFSSVESFKTPNFDIEVSGFTPAGRIESEQDAVTDCANNTPALKGIAIADRLAQYFNEKTT